MNLPFVPHGFIPYEKQEQLSCASCSFSSLINAFWSCQVIEVLLGAPDPTRTINNVRRSIAVLSYHTALLQPCSVSRDFCLFLRPHSVCSGLNQCKIIQMWCGDVRSETRLVT